jgi:hypothetical protein
MGLRGMVDSCDFANNIVVLRFEGALTDELFADSAWMARRYAANREIRTVILDFSSLTQFPVSNRPIRERGAIFERVPLILVAPETVAPDLTRWLQIMGDLETSRLRVVRTMDEAMAGVAVQPPMFGRLSNPITPEVFSLNTSVSEAGSRHLKRILGEEVELRMVLHPTLGAVKGAPFSIEYMIIQLALNAREAMPNGGQFSIETANATLGKDTLQQDVPVWPGQYVMLAVSDTGVGMDAETQTQIFKPFYTTKPVGKGIGLGLASVWGTIRENGGYVSVESELGKGTTFKIYLPRVEDPAADKPIGMASV